MKILTQKMEVVKDVNMRGWELWCGVGTIDEAHEEVRNLTKAEAIELAMRKAEQWPRVLVCQKSAKYPHGAVLAGIEYGRVSGKILERRMHV